MDKINIGNIKERGTAHTTHINTSLPWKVHHNGTLMPNLCQQSQLPEREKAIYIVPFPNKFLHALQINVYNHQSNEEEG